MHDALFPLRLLVKKEIELDIAYVLFIDTVGYSKLFINDQQELINTPNQLVSGNADFWESRLSFPVVSAERREMIFHDEPFGKEPLL